MDFLEAFLLQTRIHKNYTPQDAVKLCYQAAFGPEHMLKNLDRAQTYLHEECRNLTCKEEPLWEKISSELVRLNLRPWVQEGLPVDWLFSLFRMTAELPQNGETAFLRYISLVQKQAQQRALPFSYEELDAWYEEYLAGGLRAVSHSEGYRQANAPAYRLVSKRYLNLISVLRILNRNPGIRVIAIDGMAGSGKTTLANDLQRLLGCSLIRMDDFFLPLAMRTPERMAEAGGNIHYERFSEEVIPYIRVERSFSYRRFDCSVMDYSGDVHVKGNLRIVEGSYSCHPAFGNYPDLRVFVETDAGTQMERICQRDISQWMVERFRDSWIPMENRYHEAFDLRHKADIVINT